MPCNTLIALACLLTCNFAISQTTCFVENKKWGIKENETIIIPPRYDTIFNFDPTGKVCMACYKVKTASANKFIKVLATTYACNYLNKDDQKLRLRVSGNDTCSFFAYGKNSVKLYTEDPEIFTVTSKSKKYLVDKDFKQITFTGYTDIVKSPDPNFYITQIIDVNEVQFTGLVNEREEQVIPYEYSNIRMNTSDSLIVACSAGVKPNGNDDIYDFKGKKVASYPRHVDLATKNFIVHKFFEPKEHYLIYNIKTKEEKPLHADEIHFSEHDEIKIRIKKRLVPL